ncbi:MAG TPA: TRAM domain-containing protein, partial [Prolixibacteraceae bacterium]|nr:TRAM domain-containing protein [Prolixibacteraceae bacterium]
VPEDVKSERLSRMIELQNRISLENNRQDIGKTFEVLVEGRSKKSEKDLFGRSSQNKVVIFPGENYKRGDLVNVTIERCTQTSLIGKVVSA